MALIAVTPEELEQRVRERADMVNSEFVTSAEIWRFLEAAWQEFYAILVASGEDFFVRKSTIVSTTLDYIDLPHQFKALRLVRHASGERLRKATLNDLELFRTAGRPGYYRLSMDPANTSLRLELLPTPDQGYELDVYYVPAISLKEWIITTYVSIPIRGWDEYLVITGAAKCKDKEEADISNLMKERELLIDRIRADLAPTDKSEPDQVVQMSRMGSDPEAMLFFGDEEVFS